MQIEQEIKELEPLVKSLKEACDLAEKHEVLLNHPRVARAVEKGIFERYLQNRDGILEKLALFSLGAIGQERTVLSFPETIPSEQEVQELLDQLIAIDRFYEIIGGIVGYHFSVLEKISKRKTQIKKFTNFKRAQGADLTTSSKKIFHSVIEGIKSTSEIGEMYPLGGLGSRLGLENEAGESQPAALLPFGGRSLLEGLIRDVQAREYLYYKLYGKQVTIPIAMMGSREKGNMEQVRALCEIKRWFGRPKESFFLFSQLSVPVLTQEGKWSMLAPFKLNLQPGGHGALWRTADEKGVINWFENQKKKRLLIRQINNPIAGADKGILALIGTGKNENRTLGFASCERLPHAAEGILVHAERDGRSCISNIEYTDFQDLGIEDHQVEGGFSPYPANTNLLYADLRKLMPIIRKNPLPGLMVNMKSPVPFFTEDGKRDESPGGRLESMMQNISDQLMAKNEEKHPTFIVYNARCRTISTAKRKYFKGNSLLETPEGAFYDLLFNGHELLTKHCQMEIAPFSSPEEYVQNGPSHLFVYHPALGPLYEIISKKIIGGQIKIGSELQLEIAEFYCENLNLDGSLLIFAENAMGHSSQGLIRYSQQAGKCFLKNISVKNHGFGLNKLSSFWENKIKRKESLQIFLEGNAEFFAEDVCLEGNLSIRVPNGERWTLLSNGGILKEKINASAFSWKYQIDGHQIKAELQFNQSAQPILIS